MATSLARQPAGLSSYQPPMSLPPRSHSFSGGHARPLLSPPASSEASHHPSSQRDSPFLSDIRDPPRAPQRHGSLQLPSLAALASIASDQVRASPAPHGPIPTSMSYATAAPGQSPGGAVPAGPPICQNCQTMTTPLWRRDEMGSVLCNACGLFLKLHSRARPISLKTDVIKSRNRVKALGASGQKKKFSGQGLAAAHPDVASQPQSSHPQYQGLHRRASQQHDSVSRATTPSLYPPHPTAPNIAPQHMFDNSTLDAQNSHSYTNAPHVNRPHSPSSLANNNNNMHDSSSYPQPSYEDLLAQNNRLKTRVSELEVINDLFQGRVAELEAALAQVQRADSAPDEAAAAAAHDGRKRDVERGPEDGGDAAAGGEPLSTAAQAGSEGGIRRKKMRMSDLLDDDAARPSTPAISSADRPVD